jgi:hypothetical protein
MAGALEFWLRAHRGGFARGRACAEIGGAPNPGRHTPRVSGGVHNREWSWWFDGGVEQKGSPGAAVAPRRRSPAHRGVRTRQVPCKRSVQRAESDPRPTGAFLLCGMETRGWGKVGKGGSHVEEELLFAHLEYPQELLALDDAMEAMVRLHELGVRCDHLMKALRLLSAPPVIKMD